MITTILIVIGVFIALCLFIIYERKEKKLSENHSNIKYRELCANPTRPKITPPTIRQFGEWYNAKFRHIKKYQRTKK